MTEIAVRKTKFPEGFKKLVSKAKFKGTTSQLDTKFNFIFMSVYANKRPVGRFMFETDGKRCFLKNKLIIENEFYPLEVAVNDLIIYCRKKKIKTIEY